MSQKIAKASHLQQLKEAFYTILSAEHELYKETCLEVQSELIKGFGSRPNLTTFEAKDIEAVFQNLSKLRSILDTKIPAQDHQELLQEAKRAFKNKDYEAAFQIFKQILNSHDKPDHLLLLNAATAAYYSRHFEIADGWVDRALEINPNENSTLVLKALLLMEFRKWSEALTHLHQAQEKNIHSKLIEQSISNCREKIASMSKDKNICKRRWRRVPIKKTIQVNDFGSYMVTPHQIVSLSAGGCLIQGSSLPHEFQFRLELNPKTQIYGIAKVVYTTPQGDSGVRFESLSQIEQIMLDDAINQMASARRN